MTEDEQAKQRALQQAEAKAALLPPATYCNRVTITRGSPVSRISFGELTNGELIYRHAVMLNDTDMPGLRDLLVQLYPFEPPQTQN